MSQLWSWSALELSAQRFEGVLNQVAGVVDGNAQASRDFGFGEVFVEVPAKHCLVLYAKPR